MTNTPQYSYKDIFQSFSYFQKHPKVWAVRLENGKIIYKRSALLQIAPALRTDLRAYFDFRNDTKALIDKIADGYRNGDANLMRLIKKAPTETTEGQTEVIETEKAAAKALAKEKKQEKPLTSPKTSHSPTLTSSSEPINPSTNIPKPTATSSPLSSPSIPPTLPQPPLPLPPEVKIQQAAAALGQTLKPAVSEASTRGQIAFKKTSTSLFLNLKKALSFSNLKVALFGQAPEQTTEAGQAVKDVGYNSQEFIQKHAGKYLTAGRIASTAVGALAGLSFLGPTGAVIGAIGGASFPNVVEMVGGQNILDAGSSAANTGGRAKNAVSSIPNFLPQKKLFTLFRIGLIAGLIGLAMFLLFDMNLLETMSEFPPYQTNTPTTASAGSIGAGCPTQDQINANKAAGAGACKYLNPSIDIFNTTISPQALNSFADKYSPNFIKAGLGDINEFKRRENYIISKAQSVGLNPTIFLGYWKTESKFGTFTNAATLGCNPGAGVKSFEIEVNCAVGLNADGTAPGGAVASRCASTKSPDQTQACALLKGVRASHPDIYGSLPISYPIATFDDFMEAYGSKATNLDGSGAINNNCVSTYNQQLETAIELGACKATNTSNFSSVNPPLPSSDPQRLHDDILNYFGVNMDPKFSYDYLKWTWEKLWNASNTKFLDLVRGPNKNIITITRADKGFNEQISCSSLTMSGVNSAGQTYPEQLFKIVFIHELSHIIENCNPNSAKGDLAVLRNTEPAISAFATNSDVCIGDNNLNEDYAETIAYYLNPEFGEIAYFNTSKCNTPTDIKNPFSRGNRPLHLNWAQTLLGSSPSQPTQASSAKTSPPAISCPVVGGGANRLVSYQADPVNGHCGSAYNARLNNSADSCQGNTRRGKSIDIETGGPEGKDVELPTINGQSVSWQYVSPITLTQNDCFEDEIIDVSGVGGGCGVGYVFKTPPNEESQNNIVLHLLHMQSANLTLNSNYPSGTIIGKTQAIHTHISVGVNINNVLSQNEAGWKSVDTELHLCQ